MSHSFDRREVVLGAAAVIAAAWTGTALAAAPQRFNRVVVDVAPLRAKGLDALADRVSVTLASSLATEMAGALDPRDKTAPTLVVRIDAVMLNGQLNGSDGANSAKFSVTDYMEGEAVVLSGASVLARYPILGAYDNAMGPAIMNANSYALRLRGLSAFYAGWVRRKVGA